MKNGSTLQINGDATNSGTMYTNFRGHSGNTMNVTGTLTNNVYGKFF